MASNGRKIERVQPLLLELEKNKNDYLPQAVSMGPRHHGDPKLAFVEAFKPRAVDMFISDGPQNKEFYYNKVFDIINELRDCYEETSISSDISDADLAGIMFRDASFIIIYMKGSGVYEMLDHLGALTFCVLWRDFILLNNQIPLRVIKLLIDSRYGEGEGQKLLDRFVKSKLFREYGNKPIKWEQESERGEPLHLLEAFHRVVVKAATPTPTKKCSWLSCSGIHDVESGAVKKDSTNHGLIGRLRKKKKIIHSFRSVKDLKAKGIYCKPSPTLSLNDVNFRSHFFFAWVELPEWYVSLYTRPFFKNLVAYELSPNAPTQCEVASYINLMKSLLGSPGDVKELRDKKILFNQLGSDEEVLNVYKDIDTHGVNNFNLFVHVKDEIEAHYNSRVKTWMAELLRNNFRSPWTAIAFLAAFSVLAISAAQLYYTMHPLPN